MNLSVAAAATRLGISRQAVLKLIDRGTLQATAEMSRGKVARYLIPVSVVAHRLDSIKAPPGYISLVECATALNVDPTTVRRWIADGKLSAKVNLSNQRFVQLAAARLVAESVKP